MTAADHLIRHLELLLVAAARLAIWLAVFAAILVPIERFFAPHRQKIFRKEIAVDLGYYFLNGLLPGLALGPPISLAVLAIHHVIRGGVLATIATWPVWLKACATMLVGEPAYYQAHRMSHQIPFLWRFHAVHHSAEELGRRAARRVALSGNWHKALSATRRACRSCNCRAKFAEYFWIPGSAAMDYASRPECKGVQPCQLGKFF